MSEKTGFGRDKTGWIGRARGSIIGTGYGDGIGVEEIGEAEIQGTGDI